MRSYFLCSRRIGRYFPGNQQSCAFSTTFRMDTSKGDESFSDDDEEEDLPVASSTEPWKYLLEMPARAAWRVSSPRPPTTMEIALRNLFEQGGKSNKQLKSAHEMIIKKHQELMKKRDRERLHVLYDKEYGRAEKKRDALIQPILYGPEEVLATFRFRMFPNYSVVKRVLQETQSLIGKDVWKPKNVIDFGFGCGSASVAACDVWEDLEWIHGIDSSKTMREGAEFYFQELGKQQKIPRITSSAHLSSETAEPTFDMALFAYTAVELPYGASTLAAAAILWGKLRNNGVLVMVEPGTPDGFTSIRTVRSMLLDCFPHTSEVGVEECHIVAPCTHSGSCPLERFKADKNEKNKIKVYKGRDKGKPVEGEEDDGTRKGYCSFVQTMPGSSGLAKGEKFSYLVAQKRIMGESEAVPHRFDDVALAEVLRTCLSADAENEDALFEQALSLQNRFLDSDDDDLGLELVRGDANRSSFGRIILAPKKKKGHVLVDCCVGPGQIVRETISKSMSRGAASGVYAAARKSRWGGLWPVINNEILDDDEP